MPPDEPGLTPPPRRAAVARAALAGSGVVIVVLLVMVALLLARGSGTPAATATAAPTPSPSASAKPTVADIYQQVGPSVVVVRTGKGALGTGVIAADDGRVLTANHVISDGAAITPVYADGTSTQASVVSADAKLDVATLKPATLPQTVVPATIGGGVQVGGDVVAIGNPLGLTYSVSSGVVSGVNRTNTTNQGKLSGLIQFDASVNPGSSGGPLLDDDGDVIGIVVSIAEPAGQEAFAGIGFAVPIGAALGGGGSGTGDGGGPEI